MYRMLIVDDEPEIVESLYELFLGAEFHSLDILKTCSSREAASIIAIAKIDILLTDIRMPGINGLQLAEIARRSWPKCRIVFLTGYNEFEYAYSAIKSDCEDYILKTESDREIIKSVENAIKKMEKSYQDGELLARAKDQMKLVKPLLKKEFFMGVLNGTVKQQYITQKKLDELGVPLNPNSMVFMLLGRMDELPRLGTEGSQSTEYLMAVRLILEEVLARFPDKVVVELDNTSFVCLIQKFEDIAYIKGAAEMIQNMCKESLGITVSFVLNSEYVQWEGLCGKFVQLQRMLDFSSGIGKEAFLTDKSFSNGIFERIRSFDDDITENDISNVQNINTLIKYLERGKREEYFPLLAQITDCIRNVKSKSNNLAQEVYLSVANCLLSYINRWKIADTIAFKIGIYKLIRIDEHCSWNDAADYLQALSGIIFDTQKSDQDKMAIASVKHIQQFILAHLDEELSLTRLAELVYFNPSYLSRLFKQVTGMNISDYILDARVDKAKILLAQTDLKIHEITQVLGLGSATYFGRIFKKTTNMTPREYRESIYKR